MGRDIAPVAQWEDRAATVPSVESGVLVLVGGVWYLDTGAGVTPDAYPVIVAGKVYADTAAVSGLGIARTGGRTLAYG